MYITNTKCS